ncbi:hypothetical protein [Nocardioides sp.]|uniref:hypothetical protein n=1 Tax=Nocardioides sp. TaxID=35761 RepID=UPI0025EE6E1B|nr:hypothetical protein [Nocardioides sp.]
MEIKDAYPELILHAARQRIAEDQRRSCRRSTRRRRLRGWVGRMVATRREED